MHCPVCKTVALTMSDRQGIEIDYCPQCRGVWLDRGELDKIIERSATAQPAPAPQYAPPPQQSHSPAYRDSHNKHHDSHHGHSSDHHYKKKKHRGLLDELFDF